MPSHHEAHEGHEEFRNLSFKLRALRVLRGETGFCPSSYYHSYFQSGSSGCFKSQSGRRLRTSGKVSKLYSGGGEVVDHSSVQASQGSSPAGVPRRSDHSTLATKQPTPAT